MTQRTILAAFAAAFLALTLAGCSASADTGGGIGTVEMLPGQLPPSPIELDRYSSESSVDGATVAPGMGAVREGEQQDRAIVKSASVELSVESVQTSTSAAAEIAQDLGGTVDSQTLSNDGRSSEYADLTLRVPAAKLDDAITALGKLGEVRSEHISSMDVTESYVDLEARVQALSASITRLTALMDGAATTSDLIEAESALAQRQQELDGLNAQLVSLKGQVEMANVWVSLREASVLPGGGAQSFWGAILAGISSIGSFFVGAGIAAGYALPWLVLLGAVAIAIALPVRARRRRARTGASAVNQLSGKAADSVATGEVP